VARPRREPPSAVVYRRRTGARKLLRRGPYLPEAGSGAAQRRTEDAQFEKITRMHRQCVQQATTLARGLRLLPSTSINIRQPPDSPQPIPGRHTPLNPVVSNAHNAGSGERSFAALGAQAQRHGFPPTMRILPTAAGWPRSRWPTDHFGRIRLK
jgi:hypothetical protein